MILPLFIADAYLYCPTRDDYLFRWEVVRFTPIADLERVESDGRRRGRAGGLRPSLWVRTPALARVESSGTTRWLGWILEDDLPIERLVLSGEAASARAAWVVLARHRGGDPLYPASGPPPPAVPPLRRADEPAGQAGHPTGEVAVDVAGQLLFAW